jgi:hypothetical protein
VARQAYQRRCLSSEGLGRLIRGPIQQRGDPAELMHRTLPRTRIRIRGAAPGCRSRLAPSMPLRAVESCEVPTEANEGGAGSR